MNLLKWRISRRTFLFLQLIPVIIVFIEILFVKGRDDDYIYLNSELLLMLWSITFWTLSVFRFHDLNKSGWYVFVLLVPLVNFAFLYELFLTRGTLGENDFGVDPLYSKREKSKILKIESSIDKEPLLNDSVIDYDQFISERDNLEYLINSKKVPLMFDFFEIVSSARERIVMYIFSNMPFIIIIASIILTIIFKSWILLLIIPVVLFGFLFNSPFMLMSRIYFYSLIVALFFAFYKENFTLVAILGAGIFSSLSLKFVRLFAQEIIFRRAYYSFPLFLLLKKQNLFLL